MRDSSTTPGMSEAARRTLGARPRTDKAAPLGLLAGIALLLAAISHAGSIAAFVDLPSILIVVGGTIAVVTTCCSPSEVVTALGLVASLLSRPAPDPSIAALRALELAEQARHRGVLGIEEWPGKAQANPFFRKAIAMVVDGAQPEELEEVLRHDLHATLHRYRRSAAVLRRGADYAPAMGLIGTLVGLVQMLGHLDQPKQIGPNMAVALLTTFYGAVLANMVFSPLAAKLDRTSADEELVCLVYLTGALSICRQENPRRLELMLNSILPPAHRVRYFD